MVTLPTFHCSPNKPNPSPQSYLTSHLLTIYHPLNPHFFTLFSSSHPFSFPFPPATSPPPPDDVVSPSFMDYFTMSSSGQDYSTVDELLDFSNDDSSNNTFSPSDNDVILHQHCHNMTSSSSATNNNTTFSYSYNSNENNNYDFATAYTHSTNFTDNLCVPSDDVAELEWLSNFVHDSFSNFPANNVAGTINYRPENTSFLSRSRTKRTRAPTHNTATATTWTSAAPVKIEAYSSPTSSSSDNTTEGGIVRRCTHCSSEKTPQWRTGPLGPKTLCNACGVRYKSGRLVPEYRPAASPTFVLTQHSNSHRKVMELRRQKEVMIGQPQQSTGSEYQLYGNGPQSYHHHHNNHNRNNYEVC